MLCLQHVLSRCGWVGPQFLLGNQNTHPVFIPPGFLRSVWPFPRWSVWPHPFASSWKASPTKQLGWLFPPAWWKKGCVVRVMPRVLFFSAHVIQSCFWHQTVLEIQRFLRERFFIFGFGVEVDVRSFSTASFFVNTWFYVRGCWSTTSLYVMGLWSVALATDL